MRGAQADCTTHRMVMSLESIHSQEDATPTVSSQIGKMTRIQKNTAKIVESQVAISRTIQSIHLRQRKASDYKCVQKQIWKDALNSV